MLEIALSRSWANDAILLIDLSKAIEHRMWPYEHPLAQVTMLHRDTMHNLRQWADDTEITDLRDMNPIAIGEMVHMNERHGTALRDAALMFPTIGLSYALLPLSHDLLQITVRVEPLFTWDTKLSGSAEPFYVWIQDQDGINILQWRSILLRPTTISFDIDFVIPLGDPFPPSYTVISASDRWLGSDTQTFISLEDLVMPQLQSEETALLDVPYLHISCLQDTQLEKIYRAYITTLNSIQSQSFWTVYHTQGNVLLSAPIASGKSVLGEIAIWNVQLSSSASKLTFDLGMLSVTIRTLQS